MNAWWGGVVVAWACVQAGLAAPLVAQENDGRAVVARVSGKEILQSEVDDVLARIETMFPAAAPEGVDPATTVTPAGGERQLQLQATALEQLIDERLLRIEIERAGIVIRDAEIDAGVAQIKEQVAARGTDWDTFLKRAGRDERAMREQVALELAIGKLIGPMIDEARLQRTFEAERRQLDGTRLRVSHILLRPDIGRGEEAVTEAFALAETVRRDILSAGSTFEDAARRHSAGPSRMRGGDLGWISREGPLFDEFARVAYAVAKGDISKPFATSFGVHILKVTDVEPGRLGIEAVRAKVNPIASRQALREVLARARTTAAVQYAPGVPHFDQSADVAGDGRLRRVVVAGEGEGSADAIPGGSPR